MLRSEGEMRSHSRNHQQEKAIELRREVENLRISLGNSDSQIMSYRRRMVSLEEELQDIEKFERRNGEKGGWVSLKKNSQMEDTDYGVLKKTPKYNPY